jgi:hypothetical protein
VLRLVDSLLQVLAAMKLDAGESDVRRIVCVLYVSSIIVDVSDSMLGRHS